jgi:NAD(P)-dependent dehydrogenase (short-subunit alcohol dehydrogenase family)
MTVIDKFRIRGQVALVTGAARNLGKAIAISLAEAGADVVLASRSLNEMKKIEDEIVRMGGRASAIFLDVTDPEQVEKAVNQIVKDFGRIDILVNNAAARSSKPILEISVEEWKNVIDTNLTGVFLCCKAVGPHMIRQGGGRIINISSRAGIQGIANRVAYCSSKGGLNQLTKALAMEWAPHKILVNAIAPGIMNTSTAQKSIQSGTRTIDIPLKRAGEPEEIAPLVLYLASEAGSYMTGEVIVIDGGRANR